MSSVDQRVVEMKFNNSNFAKGISDTLAALAKLQDSLKLNGATKGAADAAAGLNQLGGQTGFLGGQFTAMQAVAFGALASIGAKAVQVGTQVAKSLTIAPIMQGFQEYETNMNSIQTILANTSASGKTGLTEVNAALDEMNHYSDKTIYNFSEMARNVGTFTAAGVDLETATGSIKGIANLAALSGSNSQQAAGAMYQLSQEIAAGKVTLMGWNSVVNAGMGGTIFQRALAETAVAMGKIDKSALTLEGDMKNVKIAGESFRDSISAEGGGESWLTSDVLTNTLQQFTGDLSEAELAAQGFSAAQIEAIKKQAATAVGAATEVKTLTGLMDTLKEGVASGWSQTFRIMVGDFEQAKQLFTGISNSVGGWLGGMSDARNELLEGWATHDRGGRADFLEAMRLALVALFKPMQAVGEAFRSIFPATTVNDLRLATLLFKEFALSIQPSEETLDKIKRTAAGLFAVLGIGWELVKAGIRFIADLIGQFSGGAGGLLSFTAGIGDFLVALHTAIKEGEGFTKFFEGLGKVLSYPIAAIKGLINLIGALFDGLSAEGAGDVVSGLADKLAPLGRLGEVIATIWSRVLGAVENVIRAFGPMAARFGEWFSNIGAMFSGGMELDFDAILKGLQLALGAGVMLILKRLADAISNFSLFGESGGGFLDDAREALQGVTGTLEAMQANLKANVLLKIAAAIAIMTLAVMGLASIDSQRLKTALAAMTVMFVQLGAGMAMFSKIATPAQAAKVILTGAALILMATAITILARAVERLANLDNKGLRDGLVATMLLVGTLVAASRGLNSEAGKMIRTGAALILLATAIKILASVVEDLSVLRWQDIVKGLAGVGGMLAALALFTRLANTDKMGVRSGLGLILLAAGLKVLASAVKDFADMSWEDMGKGLAGVAGGLVAIAAALRLMPASSLLNAAAILIVAASLKLIADAVKDMSGMAWDEIGRGMTVLAGALISIAAALRLLPPSTLLGAAAVFVVAASLGMLADALQQMSTFSWDEIGRGLTLLAGSLGIIAIALRLMTTALPGAAALLVVAGALRILLPVLQSFSEMTWEEIAKGLGMLAGVFLVIGVAGLVLAPIVPVIFGLAASIALLGAAVLVAGVGVLAFSAGLTMLAAAGAGATLAIVAIVSGLVGLIPFVMTQIGLGIIAFATVIATAGPAILAAITTVLNAFLQAIIDVTPKVVEALLTLLFNFLSTLDQAIPRIVATGFRLLLALLQGIADNIGRIVGVVGSIIVNFLNALAGQLPRIIQAGINLMIAFMNGIGDGLRRNGPAMAEAGWNMVSGMVEGFIRGIGQLGGRLVQAAKDMAQRAWDGAMDWLGINSPSKKFIETGKWSALGMAKGLDKYAHVAAESSADAGKGILDAMGKSISGLGSLVEDSMDDLNPVITPVLDLSAVQKDSSQIAKLLASAKPIDLNGAYAKASDASAGYNENRIAALEAAAESGGDHISFVQNNNSPKALSSAEIYRQTKSQLSRAKGALTTVAD